MAEKDVQHASRPRAVDLVGARGISRRIRTGCICSAAVSYRTSIGRRSGVFSEVGPSVQFPVGGVPWRTPPATPPGAGGTGQDTERGWRCGVGRAPPYRVLASTPGGSTVSSSSTPREYHRGVDAVGQALQAPARGLRQPVRRGKACLGR